MIQQYYLPTLSENHALLSENPFWVPTGTSHRVKIIGTQERRYEEKISRNKSKIKEEKKYRRLSFRTIKLPLESKCLPTDQGRSCKDTLRIFKSTGTYRAICFCFKEAIEPKHLITKIN